MPRLALLTALAAPAAAAQLALPKHQPGAVAAENYFHAGLPAFRYEGRSRVNADLTRTFDWEGAKVSTIAVGATYVRVNISSTSFTRVRVYADGFEAANLFVSDSANGGSTEYLALAGIGSPNVTLVMDHLLEPAFTGGVHTFNGLATDGTLVAPPAKTRRLEIVGDSITAGYGAACTCGDAADPLSPTGGMCGDVNGVTSEHGVTWGSLLCGAFGANCSTVAWSGKGMMENCCDPPGQAKETMPGYYPQTLGIENYSHDWSFSDFTPDALLINLGTNDVAHMGGAAWQQAFIDTYLKFLTNVTTLHYPSAGKALPIFTLVGPMSDKYLNMTEQIVAQWNAAGGNAHLVDTMGAAIDGCGEHPGRVGQYQMYTTTAAIVSKVMGWDLPSSIAAAGT